MTTPTPTSDERLRTLETVLADALKFLGHDAREGHSSTLALLELQRVKADPMPAAVLSQRLEANARKALAAIDDFAELARARTRPLRLEEVDLVDLVGEAVADAWAGAAQRGVRVQVRMRPDAVPGRADREMLAAALTKLLAAAVVDAERRGDIVCDLLADPSGWCFELEGPASLDRGPPDASAAPPPAMALARVVAQRHGGHFEVVSPGQEREICRLSLPTHLFPVSAGQRDNG
ncbi:MAG: hypothetical protein M3O01_06015 [Pseudomonadota bacterium]|nr:hypothetical protein [Pseudomonadota bacterium]